MKILKFSAEWCAPCKMITPLLEEIKKDRPDIEIVNIDVEKQPLEASRYGVRALPTLITIKDGKEFTRLTGAVTKPQIEDIING